MSTANASLMGQSLKLYPQSLEHLDSSSFMQTKEWAFVQKRYFEARAWRIESPVYTGDLLVFFQHITNSYYIAYIPYPECSSFLSIQELISFLSMLCVQLKRESPKKLLALRYDLLASRRYEEDPPSRFIFPSPWRLLPFEKQARYTTKLILDHPLETIMSLMKKKTRYNIRLAQRQGITIKTEGLQSLALWYTMLKETALRDGIGIHSEEYYRDVLSTFGTHIQLYLAYHEGEALAGIIVLYWKKNAYYLYGASLNKKRHLMPNYLLQYTALEEAFRRQCQSYDFFGLSPTANENHALRGLFAFKRGFGGALYAHLGLYDYPLHPFYTLFRILENIRIVWKRIQKNLKHRKTTC